VCGACVVHDVCGFKGGFLANPASFSSAFDTHLWRTYPYLLPCLFTCVVATFGTIMGFTMLPESEVWLARRAARQAAATAANDNAPNTDAGHSHPSLSNSNNGNDEYTSNREAGDEVGMGPPAIDIDVLQQKDKTKQQMSSNGNARTVPSFALKDERQSLLSSSSSSSDTYGQLGSDSDNDGNEPQNCCVQRMRCLPPPIRNSYTLIPYTSI
jgi:hypothetical protein